jgi:hypothetical protein
MQGDATQAMRCHRRGAATQLMPAAPFQAAARRLAVVVARSLHARQHARRSRLASGPGGQQQSVNVIHLQALTQRAGGGTVYGKRET